jgi:hypothetical protein
VLSLVERPSYLTCPAAILHDEGDETASSSEVEFVAEAVRRGSPGARVDVTVTDLLSHVFPNRAFRTGEIMRLPTLSPLAAIACW